MLDDRLVVTDDKICVYCNAANHRAPYPCMPSPEHRRGTKDSVSKPVTSDMSLEAYVRYLSKVSQNFLQELETHRPMATPYKIVLGPKDVGNFHQGGYNEAAFAKASEVLQQDMESWHIIFSGLRHGK